MAFCQDNDDQTIVWTERRHTLPRSLYRLEQTLQQRFALPPAQVPTFALWVYGTVLAGSGCLNTVIAALLALGNFTSLRQRLREWLKDGSDKAAPCHAQIAVRACFAPLLAWATRFAGKERAVFALDATAQRAELTALCVSLLFRGSALPVAWHLLAGNAPESWNPHWKRLLHLLTPALPPGKRPLLLADRGLWSPSLFAEARAAGFLTLFRVQNNLRFAPQGQRGLWARSLVPAPGCAWIGRGTAYAYGLPCTLVAVWLVGQEHPCLCLSDAAPEEIDVDAYALRMWIEAGFRNLKRFGWQWQNTRRTAPERVMRHWLVLAVATLYALDEGAWQEDHAPSSSDLRLLSVFRRGLKALQQRWSQGRFREQVKLVLVPRRHRHTYSLVYHISLE